MGLGVCDWDDLDSGMGLEDRHLALSSWLACAPGPQGFYLNVARLFAIFSTWFSRKSGHDSKNQNSNNNSK